jgi:hypothetical protein
MVPLGDKLERKTQILYTTFASSVIALIIAPQRKVILF